MRCGRAYEERSISQPDLRLYDINFHYALCATMSLVMPALSGPGFVSCQRHQDASEVEAVDHFMGLALAVLEASLGHALDYLRHRSVTNRF